TRQILLELSDREKISRVVFGDLFLQDVRDYREEFLGKLGMACEFPIWGRDTKDLANYFIEEGFKAITCCVDPRKIGIEFCGREYDSKFLSELPSKFEPCGENGEFHTFVYDGPIFQSKINVKVGVIVERDGFYFADILPK
ncbi:MAG: ATP-binding protein, partial [Nitrososphaerales archaeon]